MGAEGIWVVIVVFKDTKVLAGYDFQLVSGVDSEISPIVTLFFGNVQSKQFSDGSKI